MKRLNRTARILAVLLLVFLLDGQAPIVIPIPSPVDGGLLIPMPFWQQIHEVPQPKPDKE